MDWSFINDRRLNVLTVLWGTSTRDLCSGKHLHPFWQALMRQRLQAFLPIMLIALMVQILAPIGVAWASAIAASDPLRGLEICHSQPGSQPAGDESRTKPGDFCALCCAAPAALGGPELSAVDVPQREAFGVVWRANTPDALVKRVFSNAQARAPPAA